MQMKTPTKGLPIHKISLSIENFIPGNLFYGFKYLENNDNQIVPIVSVDSSQIKLDN